MNEDELLQLLQSGQELTYDVDENERNRRRSVLNDTGFVSGQQARKGYIPEAGEYQGYVRPRDITFEPYESGKLNEIAAMNQPGLEKAGRRTINLIPNVGLGVVKSVGLIGEGLSYATKATTPGADLQAKELDFSNALTEWVDSVKQGGTFVSDPFYSSRSSEINGIFTSDFWLKNGFDLTETIGEFAATGAGVGKLSSTILGSIGKFSNTGAKGAKILQSLQELTPAAVSAYTEGAMTGANIFSNTVKEGEKKLQDRIKNGEELDYEAEMNKIKQSAGENAAYATAISTVLNTGLNWGSINKLLGYSQDVTEGLLSKNSQQLAKEYMESMVKKGTPITEQKAMEYVNRKTLLNDVFGQEAIKEVGKEVLEENITGFAEKYYGDKAMSDLGYKPNKNMIESLSEYISSNEFAMNSLLGAIGGAGTNVASSLGQTNQLTANIFGQDTYSTANKKINLAISNIIKDREDLIKFSDKAEQENSNLNNMISSVENIDQNGVNNSVAKTLTEMFVRNNEQGTMNTLHEIINETIKDEKTRNTYLDLLNTAQNEFQRGAYLYGANSVGATKLAEDAINNKLFKLQSDNINSQFQENKNLAKEELRSKLEPIIERKNRDIDDQNKQIDDFNNSLNSQDPDLRSFGETKSHIPRLDVTNSINQAFDYLEGNNIAFPEMLDQIKPELDRIISDPSNVNISNYKDAKDRKKAFEKAKLDFENRPALSEKELSQNRADWWKSKYERDKKEVENKVKKEKYTKEEKEPGMGETKYEKERNEYKPDETQTKSEDVEVKPEESNIVEDETSVFEEDIIIETGEDKSSEEVETILNKQNRNINNQKTSSLSVANNWFNLNVGQYVADGFNKIFNTIFFKDNPNIQCEVRLGVTPEGYTSDNYEIYFGEVKIGSIHDPNTFDKHFSKLSKDRYDEEYEKLIDMRSKIKKTLDQNIPFTVSLKVISGGYLLSNDQGKLLSEATGGLQDTYSYYRIVGGRPEPIKTDGSNIIMDKNYEKALLQNANDSTTWIRLTNLLGQHEFRRVILKPNVDLINQMLEDERSDDPSNYLYELYQDLFGDLSEDVEPIQRLNELLSSNIQPNIPDSFISDMNKTFKYYIDETTQAEITLADLLGFTVFFDGYVSNNSEGSVESVTHFQNPVILFQDSNPVQDIPTKDTVDNTIEQIRNIVREKSKSNSAQLNNQIGYSSIDEPNVTYYSLSKVFQYNLSDAKLKEAKTTKSKGVGNDSIVILRKLSNGMNLGFTILDKDIKQNKKGQLTYKSSKDAVQPGLKKAIVLEYLQELGYDVESFEPVESILSTILINETNKSGESKAVVNYNRIAQPVEVNKSAKRATPRANVLIEDNDINEINNLLAPNIEDLFPDPTILPKMLDNYYITSNNFTFSEEAVRSISRSLSNIYLQLSGNHATKIAKITNYITNLHNTNLDDELLVNMYGTMLDNIDKLEAIISVDLYHRDLLPDISLEEEIEEVENNTKDDFSDDSNLRKKLSDSLSGKAKLFLGIIPIWQTWFNSEKKKFELAVESGRKTYEYGLPAYVNPNQFLNYLFAHLKPNIASKEDLIAELDRLGSVGVGAAYALSHKVRNEQDQSIINEILKILNNSNVVFVNSSTKEETTYDFDFGTSETDVAYRVNQLNKNIESKSLINEMETNIKNLYFNSEADRVTLEENKTKLANMKSPTDENIIEALQMIGLTNIDGDELSAIGKVFKIKNPALLTMIKNILNRVNDKNKDRPLQSAYGGLAKLLPFITVLNKHDISFTVRSVGNPIQSKVRFNYLTRLFSRLRSSSTNAYRGLANNAFFQNNRLTELLDKKELYENEESKLLESKIFRSFNNEGTESELKDFSPREREFNNVNTLLANRNGLFLFPTMSDKGTLPAIDKVPFPDDLVNDKGSLTENAITSVIKYLIQPEINRIKKIAKDNESKSGNKIDGYHNGAGQVFLMLDFLNYFMIRDQRFYEWILTNGINDLSNSDLAELKRLIRTHYFANVGEAKLKQWAELGLTEDGLFDKANAVKYSILYDLHHGLVRQLTFDPAFGGVKSKSIKNAIKNKLTGDELNLALYNGVKEAWDEVSKRNAALIAPGDVAIFPNKEYISLVVEDPSEGAEDLDIPGYDSIDLADAQEYTSYREHLRVYRALGKISNRQYLDLIRAFHRGESLDNVNVALQPIKPVFAGPDAEGIFHYIKTSSFPILPGFSGTRLRSWGEKFEAIEADQMSQLHKDLLDQDELTDVELDTLLEEEDKIKTVRCAFKTGKKLGLESNKSLTLEEMNSDQPIDKSKHTVLSREFFLYQLEIGQENKSKITQGSQEEIQILTDYDGDESLKNEYISTMNEITDTANEIFNQEMLDENAEPNIEILKARVDEEIDGRKLGNNAHAATEIVNGKFAAPLFFTPLFRKIEPILLNIINKAIIGLKMTGTSGVLGSEYLVEKTDQPSGDSIIFLPSFSGKLKSDEIIIPFPFGKTLEEKFEIWKRYKSGQFTIPDEFNLVYGFRIPGSGVQSTRDLKVVGYCSPILGSLTIPNKTLVTSMGSDFDVDKLNIYWKAHKVTDSGVYIIKNPESQTNLKDKLLALQNKALDLRLAMLENNPKKFTILGFGIFGNLEAIRNKKANLSQDEIRKGFNGFGSIYQQDLFKNGQAGKLGVAAYSLGVTAITKAQLAKLSLDKPIKFVYNGVTFSLQDMFNYMSTDGVTKRSEILSYLQNLAVDNAKLGKLNGLNLNKYTFDLSILLATLGLSQEQIITYITSPLVKEYVEFADKRSDSFGTGFYDLRSTLNAFIAEKDIENIPPNKRKYDIQLGRFTGKEFIYSKIESDDILNFDRLMRLADSYKSVMSNVRQKSKEAGGSFSENKILVSNYNNVLDNDNFLNIDNLISDQSSFYPKLQEHGVEKVRSFYSSMITNISPAWERISNFLAYSISPTPSKDLIDNIDNAFLAYLTKSNVNELARVLDVPNNADLERLFSAIPQEYLDDNKFFKQLRFTTDTIEYTNGLKEEVKNVIIDSGYMKDEAPEYYLDFLGALVNENEDIREFANALLVNILRTNPDFYSPVSLYQFIPTAFLTNLEINEQGDTFYDLLNRSFVDTDNSFSDFNRQFLISNPRYLSKDEIFGLSKNKSGTILWNNMPIIIPKSVKNRSMVNYGKDVKLVPDIKNGIDLLTFSIKEFPIDKKLSEILLSSKEFLKEVKVNINLDAQYSSFNPNSNTITINSINEAKIMEEIFHALTYDKLKDNPELVDEIFETFDSKRSEIVDSIGSDPLLNTLYQHRLGTDKDKLTVVAELIASSLLGQPLQDIFNKIEIEPKKSLTDKIKDWIFRLFNIKIDTLGGYITYHTLDLISSNINQDKIDDIVKKYKIC